MNRYICIHGHFYQPPRENPWLEAVELQDSAFPYHDWNERVDAECYATNATSRILDDQGKIVQMVNNYAKISFNFGPTLLAWLEENASEVYKAILTADQESQKTFSGHGSALAQAYNHLILPLANRQDKYTQILWGIKDFEHRFRRRPEGMWLPETAVDLETLDILAQLEIRFTILAPHQAKSVRLPEERKWKDVSGGKVDPTMPYKIGLPSGRDINVFFYDGPLSRAVAFEGLLSNGETFAHRLVDGFSEERTWPQLVHIATDGESYGHHHRFGDMALAYALHYIEVHDLAKLTNYGEHLDRYPPTHQVEIFENTSWSCNHGIERWRSNCGCTTGGRGDWQQAWRAPLREAFDWLRDRITPHYVKKAGLLLNEPWKARNHYIYILRDRSPESIDTFLAQHTVQSLTDSDKTTVLKLLELQRYAMLMYTSCGWFVNELSGIATVQIIQYAGRVIQLAQELFGDDFESPFLQILQKAKSNIPEHGNGRHIYDKFVKPAMVDLKKVGAHYAMSSLFEDYGENTSIYCYAVKAGEYQAEEAGRAKLAVGKATVTSDITQESLSLCFGVLHLGDHNISCGIKETQKDDDYETFVQEIRNAFGRADFQETFQLLEANFGAELYSLKALFRDEQRKILDIILQSTFADAEASYRQLYEYHVPLLRFLKESGIPAPKALYTAAEFVLNTSLRRIFEEEELDVEGAENLLEEARLEAISLDEPTLEIAVRRSIEKCSERLLADPSDLSVIRQIEAAIRISEALPFQVNLWKAQNVYYGTLHSIYEDLRLKAVNGDERAREWVECFVSLSDKLSVRVKLDPARLKEQ